MRTARPSRRKRRDQDARRLRKGSENMAGSGRAVLQVPAPSSTRCFKTGQGNRLGSKECHAVRATGAVHDVSDDNHGAASFAKDSAREAG